MNKLALIIGASSDIAKETSILLAKKNFDLVLTSRNESNLKNHFSDLKEISLNKYKFLLLDIADFNSINLFVDSLNTEPDLILIATGIMHKNETLDDLSGLNIVNTNFVGPMIMIDRLLKKFKNIEKKLSLIVLSSVAGDRGRKKNVIYGSSKAALSSYLSGIRQKYNSSNITITTVKPGFVKTKMTKDFDMSNFLTCNPDEIAKLIFYAYINKRNVIYSKYWFLVMAIVKIIPEKIFKKLNF